MKTFKLFCNPKAKSQQTKWQLALSLARAGFLPSGEGESADFCIAIGGDGTFLRMVRECKFNADTKFIGVNTGTLGFLQEADATAIESLVAALKYDNYEQCSISLIECEVQNEKMQCLNEIVIRAEGLGVLKLDIIVDGTLLQNFTGDGVLLCTSTGSTAYNLSLGGAYVPFEMDTIQLTPIAPINSMAYRTLTNSVLMNGNNTVQIKSQNPGIDISLIADGEKQVIQNFDKLTIKLSNKRISYVKMGRNPFWKKINEKFAKNTCTIV